MNKEVKEVKIAIHYNELDHLNAMREGDNVGLLFKEAKEQLETILEAKIEDYTAFRNDVLNYAIAEIRKKYSGAFALNLPFDTTIQMLGLNLKNFERIDSILKTTPHTFKVCPKTGKATPCDDKIPFTSFCETLEQHNRLEFANELCTILEKAYLFTPFTFKSNVTNGLTHIVFFDVQTGTIKPTPNFVLNGIPQ